jgi:AraC family transcriptional activator of tynA and feaB
MTRNRGGLRRDRELGFEAWRTSLRSICGQYNPEDSARENSVGWVNPITIHGFDAVDLSCGAERVERSHRDVRLDSMEHYYAAFLIGGRSAFLQNEHTAELSFGDFVLVDSTRPVTFFGMGQPSRWLTLHLPRDQILSYLGKEPEGGSSRPRRTHIAGQLLFKLVRDAARGLHDVPEAADPHLKMAVYDLIGALFAPQDVPASTPYSHQTYCRVRQIIQDRFTDPDLTPGEVARAAGISLRYLQKLFTAHGTTCTHFVQSVRLDHAERMLRRRAALHTRQPINEIAYRSGFNDYTHFKRLFRRRFGDTPIEHTGLDR